MVFQDGSKRQENRNFASEESDPCILQSTRSPSGACDLETVPDAAEARKEIAYHQLLISTSLHLSHCPSSHPTEAVPFLFVPPLQLLSVQFYKTSQLGKSQNQFYN